MAHPTATEAIKARIDQLTDELNAHNHRYYVLAAPTISDFEFDKLLRELQDLEQQFPDAMRPDSPTISRRPVSGIRLHSTWSTV